MNKILIHIPNLYANYLNSIVVLENKLPNNISVHIFIPNALNRDTYKAHLKQNIKKNIRLAKRNGHLWLYILNKFIGVFFRRFSKLYESEKWNYINDYFKSAETDALKLLIDNSNKGELILYKERVVIERIDNINNQGLNISRLKPDLFIMIGGPYVYPKILNLVPIAINVHLGLLPYYRGSKTIEWCLLNGEYDKLALTIHTMNNEIDAGKILAILPYAENVDAGVGHIHAVLFKKAFAVLPDQIIDLLRNNMECFSSDEVKNDEGYYYGYRLNSYHNYKLIKICSKKEK